MNRVDFDNAVSELQVAVDRMLGEFERKESESQEQASVSLEVTRGSETFKCTFSCDPKTMKEVSNREFSPQLLTVMGEVLRVMLLKK